LIDIETGIGLLADKRRFPALPRSWEFLRRFAAVNASDELIIGGAWNPICSYQNPKEERQKTSPVYDIRADWVENKSGLSANDPQSVIAASDISPESRPRLIMLPLVDAKG
jgi:hypothetical protein